MKARVTDQGVLVPKEFLGDVEEVEIRRQQDLVVLVPVNQPDPILQLGTQPIVCDVSDASENLDRYIYGDQQ